LLLYTNACELIQNSEAIWRLFWFELL